MTVTAQQKIFELCTDNNVDESVYRDILQVVNEDSKDSDKANMEMNRLYHDLKRKYENNQKAFTDLVSRYNSQIRSVYYLLDAVAKTGTHREKETVIMYMRVILEDLIHKGDPLPLDENLLPF